MKKAVAMKTFIQQAAMNLVLVAAFCLVVVALVRPMMAEFEFEAAQKFAAAFNWVRAEEQYKKVIALDPFSSGYLAGYAEFLRSTARYSYDKAAALEKADRALSRARELDPDNARLYLKRGLERLDRKRVDEAFRDFRMAVENDPHGFDAAYAVGYSGLNVWPFLDGENRKFVIDRLKSMLKTAPWQGRSAYAAAWKAAKDFAILKAMTPAAFENEASLNDFIVSNNLWQFRKEQAKALEAYGDAAKNEEQRRLIEKIKNTIIETEKLADAKAWTRVGGTWQMTEGGEAVIARNKVVAERRIQGLVAPEEWVAASIDAGAIKYTGGALYSNGTLYALVDFPNGDAAIRIEAKGTPAGGVWPYMVIEVDGEEIGETFAGTAEFREHVFKARTTGGPKLIGVRFLNDSFDAKRKEDRNLWIGTVRVEKQ